MNDDADAGEDDDDNGNDNDDSLVQLSSYYVVKLMTYSATFAFRSRTPSALQDPMWPRRKKSDLMIYQVIIVIIIVVIVTVIIPIFIIIIIIIIITITIIIIRITLVLFQETRIPKKSDADLF